MKKRLKIAQKNIAGQKFKKKTENQSQNAVCDQKPLARKRNLFQKKTRPRKNYEWIGKTH